MRLHLRLLPKMFQYLSVWADVQCMMILSPSSGMSFAHRLYETKPTLFALCVCSCGGVYNAYVHPREIYLSYLDHTFQGLSLKFVDLFGHHFLLAYFYLTQVVRYRSILRGCASPSFGFHVFWTPMLYVLAMPWDELYGFQWLDILIVCGMSMGLYACLIALIR